MSEESAFKIPLKEIPDSDIIVEDRFISNGDFGIIKKATLTLDNELISTVLKINLNKIVFFKEASLLAKVKHDNIVNTFGYVKQSGSYAIVLEFMCGGDLFTVLHSEKYRTVHYNHWHMIWWSLQCARAIEYLHSRQPKAILHRDLKTANMLINKDATVLKVCDFGLSREQKTTMTDNIGTVYCESPEVIKSRKYTSKCDVYSFAISMWEMLFREIPYKEMLSSNNSCWILRYQVAHLGRRPSMSEDYASDLSLSEFVQQCWDQDFNKRPSMEEIVKELEIKFQQCPNQRVDPIDFQNIENLDYLLSNTDTIASSSNVSLLEIPSSEIDLKGSFGIWNDKLVQVKQVDDDSLEEIKSTFNKIEQANIVQLYGVTQLSAIVSEYMNGPDLHTMLHEPIYKCEVDYNYLHIIMWSIQCARAVEHLQSALKRPIRNLHSKYIRLDETGFRLKLTLSLVYNKQTELSHCSAPELLQNKKPSELTNKCDVFSMGVLLWELLYRESPHKHRNILVDDKCETQLPVRGEWPPTLVKLIKKCCTMEPNQRPTIEDVAVTLENQLKELDSIDSMETIELDLQIPTVPKYRSSRIIRNIFALRFIRRGDFFKRLEKNKSATEEYYRSFLLRRLISAIRTEDELESIKSYLNIQYSKEFILFINKMALKSNKMPPAWEFKKEKGLYFDHYRNCTTEIDPRFP